MQTLVNRFLLSFVCVALSGSFIISQEAPPAGTLPQETAQAEEEASQEEQQTVQPEEVAGPKVGVVENAATQEADTTSAEDEQPEEAAEDQESDEDTQDDQEAAPVEGEESPVEGEESEEADQEAAPQEEEVPKPEEEAEVIPEDKPTEAPLVPSELKGIDTLEVDEPGGNWLVKRMWWEKAEEKMERLDSVIDAIMESRMVFFEKRDKSDSELVNIICQTEHYKESKWGHDLAKVHGIKQDWIDKAKLYINIQNPKLIRLSKDTRDGGK